MPKPIALFALIAVALAAPALAQSYPPDGPNIPIIANTESIAAAMQTVLIGCTSSSTTTARCI